MRNLEAKAWLALAGLTVVMALLLFVPAGTVRYWQAWVYLAIFAGVSALTTLDLIRKDPALLERRMRGGPTAEKQPAQKVIMLGMSIGFIALPIFQPSSRTLTTTGSRSSAGRVPLRAIWPRWVSRYRNESSGTSNRASPRREAGRSS